MELHFFFLEVCSLKTNRLPDSIDNNEDCRLLQYNDHLCDVSTTWNLDCQKTCCQLEHDLIEKITVKDGVNQGRTRGNEKKEEGRNKDKGMNKECIKLMR